MTFETEEDKRRESKAIEKFISIFNGSYQKLGQQDVDYKIFDQSKNLIAYAEVVGRIRSMKDAYPLPIPINKLLKLHDKRLNPVVIWACDDGIIYGTVSNIIGSIQQNKAGELMAYFDKQKKFKYVRYI